jgi:ATP/maltotriose-dependent transcriptional regulator MalT
MPRLSGAGPHPAEAELLGLELGRDEEGAATAALHVADCNVCTRRKAALARLVAGLESAAALDATLNFSPSSAADERPPAGRTSAGRDRLRNLAAAAEGADQIAREIVEAARASDGALAARLAGTGDADAEKLGLLYAAQTAARLAATEPHRALALARALSNRAEKLPPSGLVPSQRLEGEASLLASQALLNIGRLAEAREAACAGRAAFESLGNDPFDRALCAYFEGTVAGFQADFAFAERKLRLAVRIFASYEQETWTARAEGALASTYLQRGNPARAIPFLESAIEGLGGSDDAHARTAIEINLGRALGLVGAFERARAAFAQALADARRHDLGNLVYGVRIGLAELDLWRGETARALIAFDTLIAEADRMNLEEDKVFTRLYAAECLGRLFRTDELLERLRELRSFVTVQTLAGTPAWEDLASRLDRGDVEKGLVDCVQACLAALSGGTGLPARHERRRA